VTSLGAGVVAVMSCIAMSGQVASPAAPNAVHADRSPVIEIAHRARAVQPGEVLLLTITTSQPVSQIRVSAFDAEWPPFRVDDRTWRVLLGIDLDVAVGSQRVIVEADGPDGPVSRVYELPLTRKTFPTRRLTVPDPFVEPPPDVQKRIIEEAALLLAIWAEPSAVRLWEGPFVPPVPQQANSAFGSRSIFNGQPRSPHGGADFPTPAGTRVASPNRGRVILAKDLYFTGQTVVVDHGLGLMSLFAHLSRIDVALGDEIATGQTLGLAGATGRVTGPHLHWTVRAGGARVDPLSLLAVLGEASSPASTTKERPSVRNPSPKPAAVRP
jgi:murein DD-endopeptidase MepM/ murein hydrolase activator NlpD